MEPPAKHREEEASTRSAFVATVSRVAVAQICLTVGYDAAEPAALRSLADMAGRFVEALARSGASVAAAQCRTDANLLDLIRALEDLSLPRGFAGASDLTRPLLRSSVLRELMAFVRSVDEIPFPRPIRRESVRAGISPSFAQMGREPPLRHVPCWLPCFPESWWRSQRVGKGEGDGDNRERESWERSRRGEEGGEDGGEREGKREKVRVSAAERAKGITLLGEREGILPAVRERVRFRLEYCGGARGERKRKRNGKETEERNRKGR